MSASKPPNPPQPAALQPPGRGRRAPQPAHRRTGLRSWWSALVQWRNWRLPVKVAIVLTVPAIAAAVLFANQIRGDIGSANSFARTERLVQLRTDMMPLTADLQTERALAVQKAGSKTPVNMPAYFALNSKVDRDANTITTQGRQLLDPTTELGVRFEGMVVQLSGLGGLHQEALAKDPDSVAIAGNYSDLISVVLAFDQALSTQLGDPAVSGPATGLTDLEVAQEQVREQQVILSQTLVRGTLLTTDLTTVNGADVLLDDHINDFQAVSTPAQLATFEQSPITTSLAGVEGLGQVVLSNGEVQLEGGGPPGSSANAQATLGMTPATWTGATDTAADQLTALTKSIAADLRTTAASLHDNAANSAAIEAIILFAVLLAAGGIGVIIGRHLLRLLGILRRTALEVAEHRLPDAVASINAGNVEGLEIAPVPVHTNEELGQLARAFDAVHAQAVRSAVGQATLRANLRNIFINLSRRSQSLVERQLRLMEKLERNEEDPQQLANLFRLDHLATRMRRNNENLMVLSGDDPARRSGHPLPLADVLRAAVSEIEQYQRVVVRSTPQVDVLGYASGDLVRLVAELLDNATSFSPPKTLVRIGGQIFSDGSVRIEIRDEGIGMAGAELAEANERLTTVDTEDVPVSRQMGLYVVGRLAKRHGVSVSLQRVHEGGLLAVVDVPSELVRPGSGPMRQAVEAAPVRDAIPAPTNGHNVNGLLPTFDSPPPPPPQVAPPTRKITPVTSSMPKTSEPEWVSFTGISIPEPNVSLRPTNFTWFHPRDTDDEPVAPPTDYTPVGLPRRVPHSHALPSADDMADGNGNGSHLPQPSQARAQQNGYGSRNPKRARGFLDDYQAGIRQQQRRPDSASEHGPREAQ
jgi:signal transduction histidine kinase